MKGPAAPAGFPARISHSSRNRAKTLHIIDITDILSKMRPVNQGKMATLAEAGLGPKRKDQIFPMVTRSRKGLRLCAFKAIV